jgi:23S rRNA (adenine1618-N6)-methyltransferase
MGQIPKEEKKLLHPRNKHRSRYDFALLVKGTPALRNFVIVNPYGDESIDFSNPDAVKFLNKALLKEYYEISNWDIPDGYLCPPIPGRADYIHYLSDLLTAGKELPAGSVDATSSLVNSINDSSSVNSNPKVQAVKGKIIRVFDVGVGANCIYPIIGHQEYGWTFVGSEVDKKAVDAANNIISANPQLIGAITIKHQPNKKYLFKGLIKPGEFFDLTMCNPPFHASAEEAAAGSNRKLHNLGKQKNVLNFGGQHVELWCEGGEVGFIGRMINESIAFSKQVGWFTTLVSKSANLPFVYHALEKAGVKAVKTVEMAQGQKVSRFVAWSYS